MSKIQLKILISLRNKSSKNLKKKIATRDKINFNNFFKVSTFNEENKSALVKSFKKQDTLKVVKDIHQISSTKNKDPRLTLKKSLTNAFSFSYKIPDDGIHSKH